jgi:hypothetical protein
VLAYPLSTVTRIKARLIAFGDTLRLQGRMTSHTHRNVWETCLVASTPVQRDEVRSRLRTAKIVTRTVDNDAMEKLLFLFCVSSDLLFISISSTKVAPGYPRSSSPSSMNQAFNDSSFPSEEAQGGEERREPSTSTRKAAEPG